MHAAGRRCLDARYSGVKLSENSLIPGKERSLAQPNSIGGSRTSRRRRRRIECLLLARTSLSALNMSALGGKAVIPIMAQLMPL